MIWPIIYNDSFKFTALVKPRSATQENIPWPSSCHWYTERRLVPSLQLFQKVHIIKSEFMTAPSTMKCVEPERSTRSSGAYIAVLQYGLFYIGVIASAGETAILLETPTFMNYA
ncbi:hypothetical protein FB446DRAFT_772979 [Lentinula raphanica]|nr:hypothetical protein FB446DRAFT_772979 [Lentinula raphanica]